MGNMETAYLHIQVKDNPYQVGQRYDPKKCSREERNSFHMDLNNL